MDEAKKNKQTKATRSKDTLANEKQIGNASSADFSATEMGEKKEEK